MSVDTDRNRAAIRRFEIRELLVKWCLTGSKAVVLADEKGPFALLAVLSMTATAAEEASILRQAEDTARGCGAGVEVWHHSQDAGGWEVEKTLGRPS